MTEKYLNPDEAQAHSGSLTRPRPRFLEQVDYLRSTPDQLVEISTEPGSSLRDLRFTFRNGETFVTDYDSMIWLLKHEPRDPEIDIIGYLAASLARKLYRSRGGLSWLGLSFRDWMTRA